MAIRIIEDASFVNGGEASVMIESDAPLDAAYAELDLPEAKRAAMDYAVKHGLSGRPGISKIGKIFNVTDDGEVIQFGPLKPNTVVRARRTIQVVGM